MNGGRWSGPLQIARCEPLTDDVRSYTLINPSGEDLPFTFSAGQFLTAEMECDGELIKRSFSIASSPLQTEQLELIMKREEQGRFSGAMFERMKAGSLLNVTAPYGKFCFSGDETDQLIMIGGGVGLAPLLSICRMLQQSAWGGEAHLFASFRNRHSMFYVDELESMAKAMDRFHLHLALTRESSAVWQGRTGYVQPADIERCIREQGVSSLQIYVCGPRPMIDSVRAMADNLGMSKAQVHFEFFGPTRPKGAGSDAIEE